MADTQQIIFKIRRFNPEKDRQPFFQNFELSVKKGRTVLDGLHEIKASQDASLAMRYSCRMGICGSCAMLINHRPALACNTQILDVAKRVLCLAPLPNFAIIRDLVPDLAPMLKKHAEVKSHILRDDLKDQSAEPKEHFQSPKDLLAYLQFAYCIKCGACMAACPTLATDESYLGPMPLGQGHRYNTDSRDEGFDQRKETLGSSNGAFKCHYAGECSSVCPKGVDPARAIQLLKQSLVRDYLKLS